jgi:hypothetical protein
MYSPFLIGNLPMVLNLTIFIPLKQLANLKSLSEIKNAILAI